MVLKTGIRATRPKTPSRSSPSTTTASAAARPKSKPLKVIKTKPTSTAPSSSSPAKQAKPTKSTKTTKTKPEHSSTPTSSPPSVSSSSSPTSLHPSLKGFLPLLVALHPPSSSPSSPSSSPPARCLYYRPHHSSPDDDLPADRTLFVVNIPFYYTVDTLSEVFSCFGAVSQSILLTSSFTSPPPPSSPADLPIPSTPHPYYHSGRVIYTSPRSLTLSLTTPLHSTLQPYPSLPPSHLPLLPLLQRDYDASLPDLSVLSESIDRFMSEFDERAREEAKARRKGEDEDGWTVVRKKRGREGVDEAMEDIKRREELKQAKRVKLDFYRFAKQEAKAAKLVDLKKRFEEDKAKIAQIQQAKRKFNPR